MFNIGPAEILIIAIVVLLIFPPKQLPDIARTVGKFVRDFRRQTDEVRSTIEREFYQMDQDLSLPPASGAANNGAPPTGGANVPAEAGSPQLAEGAAPAGENGLHPGETPPIQSAAAAVEVPQVKDDFHPGEMPEETSAPPPSGTPPAETASGEHPGAPEGSQQTGPKAQA